MLSSRRTRAISQAQFNMKDLYITIRTTGVKKKTKKNNRKGNIFYNKHNCAPTAATVVRTVHYGNDTHNNNNNSHINHMNRTRRYPSPWKPLKSAKKANPAKSRNRRRGSASMHNMKHLQEDKKSNDGVVSNNNNSSRVMSVFDLPASSFPFLIPNPQATGQHLPMLLVAPPPPYNDCGRTGSCRRGDEEMCRMLT